MAEKMKIWTKQHQDILKILEAEKRFISKKEFILQGKEDISRFYFDAYGWYVKKASAIVEKPEDVHYPVWVSLDEGSVLGLDEGTVLIEMEVEKDKIVEMDYSKWGYVVNYYYIPENEEDYAQHNKILEQYGIDDATAYMSGFYPHIKNKIIKSWDAVFDKSRFNSLEKVGTIWEIKSEWITGIQYYNK